MFKVGDIIKVRMSEAHDQYSWCQNTHVYNKMMELARTKRYEIVGEDNANYEVRHIGENVQGPHAKTTIHSLFELANDDVDEATAGTSEKSPSEV